MARRRSGRPLDGWLVIDKPLGRTSTQVVAKARWALGARKAGHAGTLDPLATGLLAVAFGEATKAVALAQDGLKTYRFTMRLGQATTTDDAEGTVIETSAARPADADIRAALPRFVGAIEQVPPQFSAVRVAGARAYDLARGGEALQLAPRPLWVERLRLTGRPDPDHAELELVCGKGGYVRAIARDLGRALGCPAHVAALRRTASGGFDLTQAIAFDRLDDVREGRLTAPLLPIRAGLTGVDEVPVEPEAAARLQHGGCVPSPRALACGTMVWASADGHPVAICTHRAGQLHPDRVFVAAAT